jgi:phosphate-selective porin OprO and OprP
MFKKSMGRFGMALFVSGLGASAALPALANPEFDLRGRFHLDAAYFDEDDVPLDNGFLNRRTRIGVSGRINETWSGQIEYDFAENGVAANDVFLRGRIGPGALTIGQFKVPMGLNELTSSNNITFIERAANSNVVVDARRLGVGYSWFGASFGYQTMIYGRRMSEKEAGDMPMGVAGRVIFNPALAENVRVHLGASVAYENRQDYTTLRFRDRPEARPDGNRLIDTGNIADVDSTLKYGLELAFQSGPFSVEGEYLVADVDRSGPSPTFGGWHAQASYVLTGESRGYRDGVFRGITPGGPGGAWEVAVRYSAVDLIDAGFQGGEQNNLTLGVNYYVSSNLRFMANYIRVDVEDSAAAVRGVVVGDESPNVFLVRAQYHF